MTHDLLSQLKAKCEFDEWDAPYQMGYDSEKEPGVKYIVQGAKYQHTKDRAIMDALREIVEMQAENFRLISIMKEGFEEDLYRAIEIADETQAAVDDLLKNLIK